MPASVSPLAGTRFDKYLREPGEIPSGSREAGVPLPAVRIHKLSWHVALALEDARGSSGGAHPDEQQQQPAQRRHHRIARTKPFGILTYPSSLRSICGDEHLRVGFTSGFYSAHHVRPGRT